MCIYRVIIFIIWVESFKMLYFFDKYLFLIAIVFYSVNLNVFFKIFNCL